MTAVDRATTSETSASQRAPVAPFPRGRPHRAAALLQLQRTAGNRAVGRLLQRQACCGSCADGGPCEDGATPIGDGKDHLRSPRFRGDELLDACLQDRARLHVGLKNTSVFKVQQALFELGYDVGRRGPDSVYAARTAEAVKLFKKNEDLGFEQYGD